MKELLLRDKKGFARYLIGCVILLSEFLLTNYAISKIAGVIQTGSSSDLIKYLVLAFLARMILHTGIRAIQLRSLLERLLEAAYVAAFRQSRPANLAR